MIKWFCIPALVFVAQANARTATHCLTEHGPIEIAPTAIQERLQTCEAFGQVGLLGEIAEDQAIRHYLKCDRLAKQLISFEEQLRLSEEEERSNLQSELDQIKRDLEAARCDSK